MELRDEAALSARERLHVDLHRLEWGKELSDETLTAITNRAELVEYRGGEVVIDIGSQTTYACFLVTGRMEATLYDLVGKEIQSDTFVRGSVVGLFALGLPDRSHVRVQATERSTAIRLTLKDLLQLAAKYADFQLALFRLAAGTFKRHMLVDRSRWRPSVVGIVHHSDATRPFATRLARRLRELDESPCMAGDDEHWKPDGDIPFRLLARDAVVQDREDILKGWAANRRLLVDVRADLAQEALMRLLSYADIVLWCVRPQDTRVAVDVLEAVQKSVPGWRDKIRIVWLLDTRAPMIPYVPELHELAQRDFKLTFEAPGANQGSLLQRGFERIVHHLRGIQIGLALGGGAARGMAHLGVLKALEQHGIYIDMLAGTSAGALTGTIYAAGLHPHYITDRFKTDLRPSWFFRQLPAGGYWYLAYKYRRNHFEPMLRKYLGKAKMEQLILPVFTVSVDLVDGQAVVRETGDATNNVLESINLPPLSLPIVRSGCALVDGGLLNNIPASVLVSKGCNFVIASSVTAKLERDFAGIRSEGRARSTPLQTIPVLMRQNIVQQHNMNAVGIQPADVVIAPDVTSFDLSEFTRADEMALIGEATTSTMIAKLRNMLNKLDPKLFESSGTQITSAA